MDDNYGLLSARRLYGQERAEVICVRHSDGEDPSCNIDNIIIYDGKRGQIIYKDNKQGTKGQNKLLLTGPYHVISLDGSILIEFNLGDKRQGNLFLDADDPSTTYDEVETRKVQVCGSHPCNYMVTYALLTEAVKATVEVKLLQQKDGIIYGTIVARSDLGKIVLFESNNEEILRWSSQNSTIIPLARSVLALPLTSSLTIEVDLHNHSNDPIVRDSVTSTHNQLSGNYVLHLDGNNGTKMEVKISWSD